MGVYGDLIEGFICRFYRAPVDPREPPKGTALARVNVRNDSGEQVVLTRIVAPRRGFTMMYSPLTGEVVASSIVVRVKSSSEAEVWCEEPSQAEGMAAVPRVEREKRLLEVLSGRLYERVTMAWGL